MEEEDSSSAHSSDEEGDEEAVEGRRQARLLRKLLTEQEGSVLRAWRKVFDVHGDGRINEFQFIRMCRQSFRHFLGDPAQVFKSLDDDGSGELTLEELDPQQNDLWNAFMEWCTDSFPSASDMIQKLAPKANEKKANAKEFEEGLVKFGWTVGSERLLFAALDLRGEGNIEPSDLKWLDVQQKRAKIKRTARQRAMKARKVPKKQTWDPKQVLETMFDFKKHLKRSYGSYLRAWRLALSPNDSVTISRTQFLTACSNLGFKYAGSVLWKAFGKDELSPVSLDFLDPETAEILAHFQRLVQQLGGVQAAWRAFDKKDVKRVKMPEFVETLKSLSPQLPGKQIFLGLDLDANGRIQIDDFRFLEKWKLPEFLVAQPNPEAKEEVKKRLLQVYKTYLKAWRQALDEDNSNRCTWPEFQAACRKVSFTGDVPGAWRSLDTDLAGSITLQEIDKDSSAVLATFKKWADDNFGGIRSAFVVFDADGSNSVTLREWRHACRIYGFNQGASSLFKQFDTENNGSLALEQVAFLDDWDFQPEKEMPEPVEPRAKEKKSVFQVARQMPIKRIIRTPQGLVPPERVCWDPLPGSFRAQSRGPGTGLPKAWCRWCQARGPCRHFAMRSAQGRGYDSLMSPEPGPRHIPRHQLPPTMSCERPKTCPGISLVSESLSSEEDLASSLFFPSLEPPKTGMEIQLAALQHFPIGTFDFPLLFQASKHF